MTFTKCIVPKCRRLTVKLFCSDCWSRVPQDLRDAMSRAYTPGQRDGHAQPSAEWLGAARMAIESVALEVAR